ncbi:MAG: type II secretion system protein [Phycisphaerae bacterium]
MENQRQYNRMNTRPGLRSGFTVIELLVVIGTIGLLMSILLPTLSRARDTAKRVACASNLRQLGVAIHCYAQQYDGSIPYGPKAPPALTAANFYPATGTPTSLISLLNGQPVGAGLLLENHLTEQPKILFCPGSDQPVVAEEELEKVGTTQAQSSYYYRHDSVDRRFDPPGEPLAPLHTSISRLGRNRRGRPIRALAMDTQFDVSNTFASFGIVPRTHHRKRGANTLYLDGSVQWLSNADGRFTVKLETIDALTNAFSVILSTFESAE